MAVPSISLTATMDMLMQSMTTFSKKLQRKERQSRAQMKEEEEVEKRMKKTSNMKTIVVIVAMSSIIQVMIGGFLLRYLVGTSSTGSVASIENNTDKDAVQHVDWEVIQYLKSGNSGLKAAHTVDSIKEKVDLGTNLSLKDQLSLCGAQHNDYEKIIVLNTNDDTRGERQPLWCILLSYAREHKNHLCIVILEDTEADVNVFKNDFLQEQDSNVKVLLSTVKGTTKQIEWEKANDKTYSDRMQILRAAVAEEYVKFLQSFPNVEKLQYFAVHSIIAFLSNSKYTNNPTWTPYLGAMRQFFFCWNANEKVAPWLKFNFLTGKQDQYFCISRSVLPKIETSLIEENRVIMELGITEIADYAQKVAEATPQSWPPMQKAIEAQMSLMKDCCTKAEAVKICKDIYAKEVIPKILMDYCKQQQAKGVGCSIKEQVDQLLQNRILGAVTKDGLDIHTASLKTSSAHHITKTEKPLSEDCGKFIGNAKANNKKVVLFSFTSNPITKSMEEKVKTFAKELLKHCKNQEFSLLGLSNKSPLALKQAFCNAGWSDNCYVSAGELFSTLFPKVDLVIHVGGLGTTNDAAEAKVPSIILSMGGDKTFNGECLECSESGHHITQEDFDNDPTKLSDQIKDILDKYSEFKNKAEIRGDNFICENKEAVSKALKKFELKNESSFSLVKPEHLAFYRPFFEPQPRDHGDSSSTSAGDSSGDERDGKSSGDEQDSQKFEIDHKGKINSIRADHRLCAATRLANAKRG